MAIEKVYMMRLQFEWTGRCRRDTGGNAHKASVANVDVLLQLKHIDFLVLQSYITDIKCCKHCRLGAVAATVDVRYHCLPSCAPLVILATPRPACCVAITGDIGRTENVPRRGGGPSWITRRNRFHPRPQPAAALQLWIEVLAENVPHQVQHRRCQTKHTDVLFVDTSAQRWAAVLIHRGGGIKMSRRKNGPSRTSSRGASTWQRRRRTTSRP